MEPTVEHDADATGASLDSGRGVTETATHVEDELLVEEISIDGMCGVY